MRCARSKFLADFCLVEATVGVFDVTELDCHGALDVTRRQLRAVLGIA